MSSELNMGKRAGRSLRILALVSCVLVWAGCSSGKEDPGGGANFGEACFEDSECGDLSCVAFGQGSACASPCDAFTVCPEGSLCVQTFDGAYCAPTEMAGDNVINNNGSGPNNSGPGSNNSGPGSNNSEPDPNNSEPDPNNSDPGPTPDCDADDACPFGSICVEGSCVEGCREDSDCDEGTCNPVTMSCVAEDECSDPFEPNDQRSNATEIESGNFEGLTICEGDEDYFAFEVPSPNSPVRVSVNFIHDDGDLVAELLDPSGSILLRSLSQTDNELLQRTLGQAGTYYVRVAGFNEQVVNDYSISLDVAGQNQECTPDSYEPNDSAVSARDIQPGSISLSACADDDDWFRFQASAGDQLDIRLAFANEQGNLALMLYDEDGTTVLEQVDSNGNEERLTVNAPGTGAFLLRVITDRGEGSSNYSLNLAVNGSGGNNGGGNNGGECSDRFEPNNSLGQASRVTPGSQSGLSICDVLTDPNDYFAIEMLPRQTISTRIDFGFGADLDMEFLDANGNALETSANSFTLSEDITYQVREGGTYYLNIYALLAFLPIEYEMSFSLSGGATAPSCSDDPFESNNVVADAVPLNNIQGAVLCAGDADFYEVEISEGDVNLVVTSSFDDLFGDVDLELIDGDGSTSLISAARRGPGEELTYRVGEAGTYYVKATMGAGESVEYNLGFTTNTNPSCDDRFEENDSFEAATPIEPGTFNRLDVCDGIDDEDWFAVDLTSGDTLSVEISFVDAIADLDLFLMEPNGTSRAASSAGTGNTESASFRASADGTYFIRVLAYDGDPNTYEMTVNVEEGQLPSFCTDRFEDNNSSDNAATIQAGSFDALGLCTDTDENDWYSIALNEGETFRLAVNFSHASGNVDVRILDTDGVTVMASGSSSTDNENVEFVAPATGTYFVRTFMGSGEAVSYSMTASVEEPSGECEDRFEDNSERENSTAIEPGSFSGLSLCNDVDEEDWFAVALEEGETLSVDLAFDHDLSDVDLRLYKEGSFLSLASSIGFTDTESIEFTAEEAGTYLIRVYITRGEPNPYTMNVSVAEPQVASPCEDRFEPNNGAADAVEILSNVSFANLDVCQEEVDDWDWFFVDVVANDVLLVETLFSHADGNIDLYVLSLVDGEAEVIYVGETTTDNEGVRITANVNQRLYIVVDNASETINDYTLNVTFE